MAAYHYLEMNVITFIILFIIFFNFRLHKEKYLLEQKMFLFMLACNVIILLLDTIMWVIDGTQGFLHRELNISATVLYYVLNPIPCMLWSFYADYQIFRDINRTKRLIIPLLIPIVANASLAIYSLFYSTLFYIDQNNIYHRGPHFLVIAAICYLYFFYTFIIILKNKKRIGKRNYLTLLGFCVLPSIGGIIQVLVYGVSLIWICMALSILLIYIKIQNNQLFTDYLTGLYNRRQLDNYLLECVKNANANKDKLTAGFMIDINSFKNINDEYGHALGDQALEHTATILKNSFGENDFIARYGGDEFVVIILISKKEELNSVADRIQSSVDHFNAQNIFPYEINLSMGYDIFDFNAGVSIDEFLSHIDHLMYIDKNGNKA